MDLSISNQLDTKPEDDDVLCASTRVTSNKVLLEKFEMMKEPGFDSLSVLKEEFRTNFAKKAQQLEEQKKYGENLSKFLYEYIIDNVFTDFFPQRVNIELLRSKDPSQYKSEEIDAKLEESSEIIESEVQEEPEEETEEETPDRNLGLDTFLCVNSSSIDVVKYVNDICQTVLKERADLTKDRLSTPVILNDLALLRNMQDHQYEITDTPE